ncbi:MAG: hypothetical protein ACC656_02540 [Candidatus Heimdallarchaeota archaeon]
MNIILDAKSKTFKKSQHQAEKTDLEKSFGFAVKLSTLEIYGISIIDILKQSNQDIIIDAEFAPLDYWLKRQMQLGNITQDDLKRLLFTVQAKRYDAEEQLQYFEQQNISVVLVVGHRNYLRDNEKSRPGIKLIAEFYQKYSCISYLGISAKTHEKLNKILGFRISDQTILELYGDHKLTQSSLWVYWVGSELSSEARSYIERRAQNGPDLSFIQVLGLYFIRSRIKIETYRETRTLFIYLDVFNKDSYFKTMKDLESTNEKKSI